MSNFAFEKNKAIHNRHYMIFDIDISPITTLLLAVSLILTLLAVIVGLKQMRTVARAGKRFPEDSPEDADLPAISVIVYAHNAEKHIKQFLTSLLEQDHPHFEVIVVNDASEDNTAEIVDNMIADNPQLYMTFVSPTARNISHRKLAYTIGLRAAKHPVALLTSSNVEVPHKSWLRHMSAPFADQNIEIGIGMAYVPAETDKGKGKYWRAFDVLTSETRWLGAALEGKTYRGLAYNLAFRPKTFFEHNGFASTNRFQGGEDDIFINEISTPDNTTTIFRPEAMPAIAIEPAEYPRLWMRSKERYTFTSHYLHSPIPRMQGLLSLCLWGRLACLTAAIVTGLPNLLPAVAALLILGGSWGYQICVYRRAASALKSRRLLWTVPLYWLVRPVANAIYRASFQANRHTNYTWQQPK